MKIRIVNGIRNAHYLENGAVDCEVLFEGETEFVPYTAMQNDSAPTGQNIWLALHNGKWGDIAPFVVTPDMLVAAKADKRREIELWRTAQEAQPFTFEWAGRFWNAGPESIARLSPVVMAAKSTAARSVIAWGDTENTRVPMSMDGITALATAMALAQVERNDMIYLRQREMKDALDKLTNLNRIREFSVNE